MGVYCDLQLVSDLRRELISFSSSFAEFPSFRAHLHFPHSPVWFGESIPELSRISQHVQRADLILVLGTSSTVYPAAGFASEVRSRGGKAAIFNIEEEQGSDSESDWFFRGPVAETLSWALGMKSSL